MASRVSTGVFGLSVSSKQMQYREPEVKHCLQILFGLGARGQGEISEISRSQQSSITLTKFKENSVGLITHHHQSNQQTRYSTKK